MPDVYASTLNSYDASVGELGTASTIRISKSVWRLDGDAIDADNEYSAIVAEGHLPVQNQIWAAPSSGMTWEQFARMRTISYRLDKTAKLLTADIVYSTVYYLDPAQTPEYYQLPAEVQYSSKTRSTRIYRQTWTTNPPATSANSTADIGGTAVGNGYAGISVQVNQVAVRVTVTFDASVTAMNTMYADKWAIVGSTNSSAFGGFPAYSLICEAFNIRKSGQGFEFYEGVYDFLWDQHLHFSQVPTTGEDGQPVLNNSFQPNEVKWIRLARTGIDFNLIFPDGAGGIDTKWRDLTLTGWWE